MKAKTTILTVIVVSLLVTATWMAVNNQQETADINQVSVSAKANYNSHHPSISNRGGTRPSDSKMLAIYSSKPKEVEKLLRTIYYIEDDVKRLDAIRNQLGINLSDDGYQNVIKEHGYQLSMHDFFDLVDKKFIAESPIEAIEWRQKLIDHGIDSKTGAMKKILAIWMNSDKAAAQAYISANFGSETEMNAIKDLAASIAPKSQEDINQRLLKAKAMTDENERHSKVGSALRDLAKIDPKAALDLYLALSDENIALYRNDILNGFVKKWAIRDPDAALAWAMGIENEAQKGGALVKVIPSWRLKNPDADLSLDSISDAAYSSIVRQVTSNWAASDPAAAIDFALAIKDSQTRHRSVISAHYVWLKKAPDEAIQWARDLPQGELRDDAFVKASSRMARDSDFQAAEDLVRQIRDEAKKNRGLLKLVGRQLEENFQSSMRLMNELTEVDIDRVETWALQVGRNPDSKEADAFRAWVKQADTEKTFNFDDTAGSGTPQKKQEERERILRSIINRSKGVIRDSNGILKPINGK